MAKIMAISAGMAAKSAAGGGNAENGAESRGIKNNGGMAWRKLAA